MAAAFAALFLFTTGGVSPLLGLLLIVPAAFAGSWGLYRLLLMPLVKRAPNRDALEVDSILATFGMLFVVQGVMLVMFGGAYHSYAFLAVPVQVLGATVAANRLLALGFAAVIGVVLYLGLTRTRLGTAVRAVAVDPVSAQLVAIDVKATAALAFALGGALVAVGGVGNLLGCLVAGLILGLTETFVATWIDPGLTLAATYAIFLITLLMRPQGLFGSASR